MPRVQVVGSLSRDRDGAWLPRMLVLPVAPSRSNELPAVGLHDPDDLPDLQSGMIVGVELRRDKMACTNTAERDR